MLAGLLGCMAAPASLAFCDFTDGNKNALNPVDLGTWDGVSDITVRSPEVCIVSSIDPSRNSTPIFPYSVSAVTIPPTGGDQSFRLYSSTDPTQSLPVTLRWLNPGGTESSGMDPATFTSSFPGRNRGQCQKHTFDTNGQLEVGVNGSVLQSLGLPPGTYTADIEVTARSDLGDLCTPTTVSPTIIIPGGLVKIGSLDDIVLTWSGVGDLTYNEPFCVYSNTGTYGITPSTATLHLGDPQSFALENAALAGDTVPYTVQVDDDANADASIGIPATNGQTIGGLAGNPTEPDCISGDNAAVFIRLLESDLQGLTGLNYSGTLVLTVEPL